MAIQPYIVRREEKTDIIYIFNIDSSQIEYKTTTFENPDAAKSCDKICALMNRAYGLGYLHGGHDESLAWTNRDDEDSEDYDFEDLDDDETDIHTRAIT